MNDGWPITNLTEYGNTSIERIAAVTGGIMNKIQLHEDLGKVLYILCDYIAEESDQYLEDKKMLEVLQRAFDEIADIHESLEEDGGMYSFEPLFAAL